MPTNAAKDLTVTIQSVRVAGSGRLTYVAVPVHVEPRPVRWAFLLFIFSIPFEAQELGMLTGLLSPARIFGTLFFLVYVLYHNPFLTDRQFPSMSFPVRWFLVFLALFAITGYVFTGSILDIVLRLVTFAQLFAFLWLASDLLRDLRFSTQVLLTFALALSVLAASMLSGVGGLSHEVAGRTVVLEEDLNGLATNMGIAVLIFIGLWFSSALKTSLAKLLCGAAALLPLLAIAKTGSRGGLIAFVAGLMIFALPLVRQKWRWGPALIGLALFGIAGYMVATNTHFVDRIYESYFGGNLAGREQLYPVAIEMILERPFFGWQGEAWFYEMRIGARDGAADPHNLFLHLLLHVGFVGTAPYVIALWLCGRWAWKHRGGPFGLLPLALFTTALVASMSISTTTWKTFWFVLAVSVSCGEGLVETRRIRRCIRATR